MGQRCFLISFNAGTTGEAEQEGKTCRKDSEIVTMPNTKIAFRKERKQLR